MCNTRNSNLAIVAQKLDKCIAHTQKFPTDFGIQIFIYMSKKYENHEKGIQYLDFTEMKRIKC